MARGWQPPPSGVFSFGEKGGLKSWNNRLPLWSDASFTKNKSLDAITFQSALIFFSRELLNASVSF